jgi:hypothetical protein
MKQRPYSLYWRPKGSRNWRRISGGACDVATAPKVWQTTLLNGAMTGTAIQVRPVRPGDSGDVLVNLTDALLEMRGISEWKS